MRDETVIAEISQCLPDAVDELLQVALDALHDLHDGIIAGSEKSALTARHRYDAVVWKLNGGSFFGCEAGEGAAVIVRRHCAAIPGNVPMWGQSGEFLIEQAGTRAVVSFSCGLSRMLASLSFHAVDPHVPFISPTGYRSEFRSYQLGKGVAEVATGILRDQLSSGPVWMEEKYRARVSADQWHWLDAESIPVVPPHDPAGQFMLAL